VQVWEGNGVVASARKLIGATNPLASEPGTIRGDFAIEVGRNIIHGSDSVENGERETGARGGNYQSGKGGF
jgi:nucleoside-diphosphate kinase